jgi:hypothetical protein
MKKSPRSPRKITMTTKSFFGEHKKLVALLRTESKKLAKEANEQEREAKKWKAKLKK